MVGVGRRSTSALKLAFHQGFVSPSHPCKVGIRVGHGTNPRGARDAGAPKLPIPSLHSPRRAH